MPGRKSDTLTAYLLLAPFLVLFAVFLGYPVFYSLALSLKKVTLSTDWYRVFEDMSYCGLDNYRRLFTQDCEFWWSLLLTLLYATITIPVGIAMSLGLAILLSNKVRGVSFFRGAFFLPNVLDPLVVGVLWVFICAPQYGLFEVIVRGGLEWLKIPQLLQSTFGITASGQSLLGVGLLGNPWTVLPTIAIAMVLKGAGFGMILFLTAIQNIPEDLFEAADLDGASTWDKLLYITIPHVKPVILFMVVTGVMGSLNAFTEIYAMTGAEGGPATQVTLPTASGALHLLAYAVAWVTSTTLAGLFVSWWCGFLEDEPIKARLVTGLSMVIGLIGAIATRPDVELPIRFTARAASVSGFYLFKTFERGDYGYAAAIAFVLMAIALIISAINMYAYGRED